MHTHDDFSNLEVKNGPQRKKSVDGGKDVSRVKSESRREVV